MSARISLIVVAAGRGSRLGGGIPKQYLVCAGKPLICHTLEALAAAHEFAAATVVIHPDDLALYEDVVARLSPRARAMLTAPAFGGETRQQSVRLGLEAQRDLAIDIALIHDGARPFPSAALVARAIQAAIAHGAAVPGTPVTDTIKQIDAEGRIVGAPDRATLRAVQTPQAFQFDLILAAHRRAEGADLTDDAAVAERVGVPVHVFDGDADNFKVTTMQDLAKAEARLGARPTETRVGQGFDVHAFAEGGGVWLAGVFIPHEKKLAGHSDADVALHAIADAIYGALGEGDIGRHFPPGDPQWKGAASSIFLDHAAGRVRARGGRIAHIDVTLICEAPKIGPHRETMRARIAEISGIAIGRTAVKATTSEKLGFTGRREGIACLALATVELPAEP
ncbi:MAG: bifunctional 2-C-methyl-D-erythritol 4-phosphate cytidylyltransferase/2-C-methyl-D-erythritol 2,4-cyclodiphosphate synthase [Roseiarcus sp.]